MLSGSKKLILVITAISAFLCSVQADDYAALLAKARDYESKGQYAHALGTYWDAMESAPGKASEACDAYGRIARTVGSEAVGSNNDSYTSWIMMYTDLESYCLESGIYALAVSELKKGRPDKTTGTLSYSADVSLVKSKKYDDICSLFQTGNKAVRGLKWKAVPADFDKAVSAKVPSGKDYSVQFALEDRDGNILSKGELQQLGKTSVVYVFSGLSEDVSAAIDDEVAKIVPVVFVRNGEDIPVKLTVKGGFSTDTHAVALSQFDYGTVAVKGTDSKERNFSFRMMSTEVTQLQYKAITGKNPSSFKGRNRPAECISWYKAVEFCNLLSETQGLTPVYSIKGSRNVGNWGTWNVKDLEADAGADGWRLPSLYEWLFAFQEGEHGSSYAYSGSDNLDEVAWYGLNSKETHDVASKKPNALGIYDMSGNVWEWCFDLDGVKTRRGIMGGSWLSGNAYCQAAEGHSYAVDANAATKQFGFRIVRSAE